MIYVMLFIHLALDHTVTAKKNCGKWGRGRQWETIFDNLLARHEKVSADKLMHAEVCTMWRSMISHAS